LDGGLSGDGEDRIAALAAYADDQEDFVVAYLPPAEWILHP
jgi:hypothetical protein